MKNIKRLFSKSFLLLLVVSITCISLVACNKNKSASSNTTPATTIKDNKTDESLNADNVSEGEKNQTVKLEALDGLYQIQTPVQITDIYYDDLNKVLNFYKTRDLNGLYHILAEEKVLDFYKTNDGKHDWFFFFDANGLKKAYYNKSADIFCILKTEPIPYSNIIVEQNNENIKLYVKCSYFSESQNKIIEAPFYIVSSVKHIKNSDKLFANATNYTFKNTPVTINLTNANIDKNDALVRLAKICRVDEKSETLQQDIIQTIFSWKFKISPDFDRLSIEESSSNIKFAGISENNTYMFNGFEIMLSSRQVDLESSIESLDLTIILTENITVSFEISIQ